MQCARAITVGVGALAFALIAAADATGSRPALNARQAQQYQAVCARCHAQPNSGAPLVGDAAAWTERAAGGFARLLARSIDGYRGMPPLGTCGSCSEADLRVLVAYVSGVADPAAAVPARADPGGGAGAR